MVDDGRRTDGRTDGRTTEHGYTISSPCEPDGSGELIILRLHYVPGGHGGHVSDNREQNGITVRQGRGTGYANIACWDNRGHRDKFFDSLKICHGSHGGNEKRNGP